MGYICDQPPEPCTPSYLRFSSLRFSRASGRARALTSVATPPTSASRPPSLHLEASSMPPCGCSGQATSQGSRESACRCSGEAPTQRSRESATQDPSRLITQGAVFHGAVAWASTWRRGPTLSSRTKSVLKRSTHYNKFQRFVILRPASRERPRLARLYYAVAREARLPVAADGCSRSHGRKTCR